MPFRAKPRTTLPAVGPRLLAAPAAPLPTSPLAITPLAIAPPTTALAPPPVAPPSNNGFAFVGLRPPKLKRKALAIKAMRSIFRPFKTAAIKDDRDMEIKAAAPGP